LFQISILPCSDKQICEHHAIASTEPNDSSSINGGGGGRELEIVQNGNGYYQRNALVPLIDSSEQSDEGGYCEEQKKRCSPLYGMITSSGFDAFTFGMAAFIELLSCLYVDQDEGLSDYMSMFAAHIYFVNAAPLFLTSFHEQYYWKSDSLEDFGDLMFLMGVIIDVVLSYWELYFPSNTIVAWFYLLSALLWLADAIVCIVAQLIYRDEDNEHNHFLGDDGNADHINLCSDRRNGQLSMDIEDNYGSLDGVQ
jgi:hypothetical protein